MPNGKTMDELMEEARIKAGAQEYAGHSYMDLVRFDENTRHMLIFDVLSNESRVGYKGDRMRYFMSDEGYEKALGDAAKGKIRILTHARVYKGDLIYDRCKCQLR